MHKHQPLFSLTPKMIVLTSSIMTLSEMACPSSCLYKSRSKKHFLFLSSSTLYSSVPLFLSSRICSLLRRIISFVYSWMTLIDLQWSWYSLLNLNRNALLLTIENALAMEILHCISIPFTNSDSESFWALMGVPKAASKRKSKNKFQTFLFTHRIRCLTCIALSMEPCRRSLFQLRQIAFPQGCWTPCRMCGKIALGLGSGKLGSAFFCFSATTRLEIHLIKYRVFKNNRILQWMLWYVFALESDCLTKISQGEINMIMWSTSTACTII